MPPFISAAKDNIEVGNGAKIGVGDASKYLREAGFPDGQPLGEGQLVQSNDLLRHHDQSVMDSGHEFWMDAFTEYAEATKYGVLVIVVKPEYLHIWASARASLKEIEGLPNGRVFVYIEDDEEIINEDGSIEGHRRQGYILHMNSRDSTTRASNWEGFSATVSDGKGIIIFDRQGGYYRGQLKDCKAHGSGKLVRANEEVYVGEFKENKQHGKGTYTFANGDVYSGDWIANKCHGKGKLSWADGDLYEGDCKDDKPDGKGTYKFANGDIYEGDFVHGKMHGRGKFKWYGNGEIYEGEYRNEKFHGEGKYTYANGNTYEGEYKDGMFHGRGLYTWANGSMRHGTWENGRDRKSVV